jgi:hypothetical protein
LRPFGDPGAIVRMTARLSFAVLAALAATLAAHATAVARDALRQPFASSSIWNTPIGSAAAYVDTGWNLDLVSPDARLPKLDEEIIVLRPKAREVAVLGSNAAWTGRDRCHPTGGEIARVPVPDDFVVPNSGENNSAAFLARDGRTILQMQPFTRCEKGGDATSLLAFPPEDLYGDGITGAHGGSGLSAFGGSLRVGELRRNGTPPRHALKLLVDARIALASCWTRSGCFRWPAIKSDNYAVGVYGARNSSVSPASRMGALVAIPANVRIASLGLKTAAAKNLAWTLQNYGAYIIDDTENDGFGFAAETGPDGSFAHQFRKEYGFDFVSTAGRKSPWAADMRKLVSALKVVDNNGPDSVGGGGKPLQPPAPPLVQPERY